MSLIMVCASPWTQTCQNYPRKFSSLRVGESTRAAGHRNASHQCDRPSSAARCASACTRTCIVEQPLGSAGGEHTVPGPVPPQQRMPRESRIKGFRLRRRMTQRRLQICSDKRPHGKLDSCRCKWSLSQLPSRWRQGSRWWSSSSGVNTRNQTTISGSRRTRREARHRWAQHASCTQKSLWLQGGSEPVTGDGTNRRSV